jgi:hypothetical protein
MLRDQAPSPHLFADQDFPNLWSRVHFSNFLQKSIAYARFATKRWVCKCWQTSIYPSATANRSSAVRGTALISALYQWVLKVRQLPANVPRESFKREFGAITGTKVMR